MSTKRKRPEETVVGRHYHYHKNDEHIVGELKGTAKGGVHLVEVWSGGKPTGQTQEVRYATYDVREISRSEAHDISKAH